MPTTTSTPGAAAAPATGTARSIRLFVAAIGMMAGHVLK